MEASQRKLARERSNDALGELLQAIIYAKVDAADQENAGMLSLGVGNVRNISEDKLKRAGHTLALALMILGRETNY